jgi:hypothetical protein
LTNDLFTKKKKVKESKDYLDQTSIYKKKDSYKQRDFFEFYEGVRFSSEFMVYRTMEWWGTFDQLAGLGHSVYAAIVVLAGLFV